MESSMKNMIKRLVLDIDGKEISLTMEQAKKLQSALNEVFETKIVREKEYIPTPYVPKPVPWYPYTPARPWYEPPYFWRTITSANGLGDRALSGPTYMSKSGVEFTNTDGTVRCSV